MTFTRLSLQVDNGLAHLRLNRPEASNALDLELAQEVRRAIAQLAADTEVRSLLVDGAGPRFCGGGDLKAVAAAPDPQQYLRELATEVDLGLQELAALPLPVVMAVHGSVAGGGLPLMLSGDLVVAASDTKFVSAYIAAGLTPDCGLSWVLPRTIGHQRALAFLMGNQPISAETAADWGMISTVVEPENLTVEATALARRLADQPTWALAQTAALVRRSATATRAEIGALEAETISQASGRPEARARIERFVKR